MLITNATQFSVIIEKSQTKSQSIFHNLSIIQKKLKYTNLLKKSSGLGEQILVAVFKSLVLSHYRYGSVALDSCTKQAKAEMKILQNRMLRIICITRTVTLAKYKINDVSDFIEKASLEQIILSGSHSLSVDLKNDDENYRGRFPFMIPRARTATNRQS